MELGLPLFDENFVNANFTFSKLLNIVRIDPIDFIRLWFLTKSIISDIDIVEHQDINVINFLFGSPFDTAPPIPRMAPFGQNIMIFMIMFIL